MTYELSVAERHVVIVGAGPRTAATISGLLGERATVTLVADRLDATVEDLVARGLVRRAMVLDEALLDDADIVLRENTAQHADRPASSALGTVTLVGGGPGDPGLMSLAGREAIEKAEVIVTDRLVPHAVLSWAAPDTEVIDVAKIPHGRFTPQEEINRILVEAAQSGRAVVRLKGGDNFVFGRGGEELIACAEAGIPTQVVPGLSSALAVPGAAGIPLTHRGLTQGFAVVSGHVAPDDPASTVDWEALASSNLTIVVLMGVRQLGAIATRLVSAGLASTTPAAVIADGTLPSQRVVRATLDDIAARAAEEGIGAPAVTVIGRVAGLELG
ncbi:uroporphyrinogen-III C-methyltransferase [Aeromicrobium piscarium]|uniref:uroporphyrinogen-III C-methyltransferase n=1 Tax=Aeromicrobium piscarium TaxID=2590901 RepID=A0A554S848_9ACTN|nr:uroporphyrinogen-III C-methyltransferase [Aeromicrobium piscarium]TSD62495.1 uroporphyrinogen-III C-methyltransferase [Aeromicrobium piscarium]